MKRITMVLITIWVISLIGCIRVNNQNAAHSGNGDVHNEQTESYSVITEVNVDTVVERHPSATPTPVLTPLHLAGWEIWSNSVNNEITVRRDSKFNECIINSTGRIVDTAGFVLQDLTILRGKTLVLEFSNINASIFSQDRMIMLEYADNDVVLPSNINPIFGGFIPGHDTLPNRGVEFPIPNNFAGRINFKFYQAELNDLKITAWYR